MPTVDQGVQDILSAGPRFPVVSKKRGMARAVEIVEWLKAYTDARAKQCKPESLLADVYRSQLTTYDLVLQTLRSEMR